MICRSCGLQNPPGFTYCGSCGEALAGASEVAAAGVAQDPTASLEDTVVTQAAPARPAQRSRAQAVPVVPSRSEPAVTPSRQAVVCRNCGRANGASRSVCYQCGRRLVMPPELRLQRARPGQSSGGFIAGGVSVVAIVLAVLAGGLLFGVMLLGGGSPPSATPIVPVSPVAAAPTASPASTPFSQPTRQPAVVATSTPSAVPTPASVTPSPAAPNATSSPSASPSDPVTTDCSASAAETAWLNLTRDDTRRRVPEDSAWCLHQVYVVPYFGSGRIRLVVDGETLAEVDHPARSAQAEYSIALPAPVFVEEGARVAYQYRCAAADCAAAIQVGYDELPLP